MGYSPASAEGRAGNEGDEEVDAIEDATIDDGLKSEIAQSIQGSGRECVAPFARTGSVRATPSGRDGSLHSQLAQSTAEGFLLNAAPQLAIAGAMRAGGAIFSTAAAKGISNTVPQELARVIPGRGSFPTLGPPGRSDVFVTAAEDIAGLNAKQIAQRLTINEADTFTIIRFPTPQSGLASPINRLDPGFVGGGRTAGGAREFVIPNGPIPAGAKIGVMGP